jgi:hypothetical protein
MAKFYYCKRILKYHDSYNANAAKEELSALKHPKDDDTGWDKEIGESDLEAALNLISFYVNSIDVCKDDSTSRIFWVAVLVNDRKNIRVIEYEYWFNTKLNKVDSFTL